MHSQTAMIENGFLHLPGICICPADTFTADRISEVAEHDDRRCLPPRCPLLIQGWPAAILSTGMWQCTRPSSEPHAFPSPRGPEPFSVIGTIGLSVVMNRGSAMVLEACNELEDHPQFLFPAFAL